MLYIVRNGINVAFLNDVRGTVAECEFFKKKIKGCLEVDCFVSSSPVEDPCTPNGKVKKKKLKYLLRFRVIYQSLTT